MLLAHGTTGSCGSRIQQEGFRPGTYFLKMYPDPVLAIAGAAGFALRDHPLTSQYIDMYCKQDLLISLFKRSLQRSAERYVQRKTGDSSRGLIYLVEASRESFSYERGLLRALFVPAEVISTTSIPPDAIRRVLEVPEHLDISLDPLPRRAYNAFYGRLLRVLG